MSIEVRSPLLIGAFLVTFLSFLFGCAAPSEKPAASARAAPPAKAVVKNLPKTLAFLPFENNSVTEAAQFEPLSKGIPAMLTTELRQYDTSVKLIERSRIQAMLSETAYGQAGVVDESAAIQAGKMLGAESIGLGSFIVLGPQVRIDARLIGVETGEVIAAESVDGASDDFMALVRRLGQKIGRILNMAVAATAGGSEQVGKSDIQPALLFSRGLDALDRNDRAAAEKYFAACTQLDPSYSARVSQAMEARAATPAASDSGAAASAAAANVIETQGISFTSREDALRQAQRAAVEQAVGVYVESRTEMENFEVKKDAIFSRTQGYITRYEVLDEQAAGEQYTVKIRAQVSMDKIKDDLMAMKILLESMAHPKVMILVDETHASAPGMEMNLAETELTALFKAKGFDVIDSAQFEKVKSFAQTRQTMADNPAAAMSLGLLGAQYAVLGKAAVEDAGEAFDGSGMKSIQAALQLKVVQTQTGRVLGSVVKNGAAAHISALTGAGIALRKAAKSAFNDYLADAITESFQDFLNNGAPVTLNVTGVETFQRYKAVSEAVDGLEKIVSSKKEVWNKAGGLLVLGVMFRGTSVELAELLDGRDVQGAAIEVTDFAPERVDCRLKLKQ